MLNKNELEIYFNSLREKFENLNFPVGLQLSANLHAISVFYDPIKKNWMLIDMNRDEPSEPIFITDESTKIANQVYDVLKFGHEGKQGLEPIKPYLIMSMEIYTAKQYENELKQSIALLDDDKEFQSIFETTPIKSTAVDKGNYLWLDWAIQNGQVETVKMLHEKHAYKNRDSILDNHKVAYMRKIIERCDQYYQSQTDNNYTYRNNFIALAYDLHHETIAESIPEITNKRLQYKFILEILKNASIEENGAKDEANITKAILLCYAQWSYQGYDVRILFANEKLATLIQQTMAKHTDFITNINEIAHQDNELTIRIRQAIHELEKDPINEEALVFLSNCLIVAGNMAVENSLKNIRYGVLEEAIQCVHTLSQNTGKILSENVYIALNAVGYFREKIQPEKVETKINSLKLDKD